MKRHLLLAYMFAVLAFAPRASEARLNPWLVAVCRGLIAVGAITCVIAAWERRP